MQLQLKRLRTEAGYARREAFAEAFGVSERKVKSWELGERKLSFDDACALADFFGITLDDLAGRFGYADASADEQRDALIRDYEQLDANSKAEAARFIQSYAKDPDRRSENA